MQNIFCPTCLRVTSVNKDLVQDGHATYLALNNQNHLLKASLNVAEIYSHRRKLLKGFEGVGNLASERGEGRGGFRKRRGQNRRR